MNRSLKPMDAGGCDCKNKWSGTTCTICPPPFTGTSCDRCLNPNMDYDSNCLKCVQGRFGTSCEHCTSPSGVLKCLHTILPLACLKPMKEVHIQVLLLSIPCYSFLTVFGEWSLDASRYSYTFLTPVTTKTAAENACQARNAQLVSIRATEERDFVTSLLNNVGVNAWTGFVVIFFLYRIWYIYNVLDRYQ